MPAQVRVYDSRIFGMHAPGGEVYRESVQAAREIKVVAETIAPSRTGTLKRQHRVTNTGLRPLYTTVGVINTSDHAEFVHDGTQGPIESIRGFPNQMIMRPAPHSLFPVPTRHVQVRGQNGNPWLWRAGNLVISRRYRVNVARGGL